MEVLDFLAQGFATAFQWRNLLFALFGVIIGTSVGVLPGIGPMSGVALLIPITSSITGGLSPEEAATSSIIMLAGVYYGAMYGGSATSILINTPGESASVVTTLDGYQMAKQGRAGEALSISAIGSFFAGIMALIGLIFLAQPLSDLAISFGPVEYTALIVLGLATVSGLAGKSMIKALIMTVAGLSLSTVGVDTITGVARFTFNQPILYSGIEFLTIAVGLFAIGEVLKTIAERDYIHGNLQKINRILPTKKDLKDSSMPILRGSILGFFIGILPGAGASIASFFSYSVEKSVSKDKGQFGAGAIQGVAGPEAANNAASGGSLIPLLTLGIPGSGTTAIMMGALLMYNVQPGPLLFDKHPQVAWGLIASMFIGNLLLLILNMPLIRVFAKIIATPPKYLLPIILAIAFFGVYAVQVTMFDLFLLIACGVLGYLLSSNDFPLAPLVLGLILGPMLENNFRRALTISNGDYMIFLGSTMAVVMFIITILWLASPAVFKVLAKNNILNKEDIHTED
ncbi:tripartite tricarboxylate transporter permease [Planomicrobium sp. CPCC 101079]|uniref:tripartite tricarboxylate transporter permease n=1 Tax=Planomicrobium sp. CPCC 101079 TaxID=2599618 RepID=UPI0011B67B88|nr:tripartite tricarboxylate transporter permease [Planomicrobium sp. CPCC 101079]TWT01799.1 tripartite tricarboxylate transporter permease [Planomicrobium sp. CPCC 101079]